MVVKKPIKELIKGDVVNTSIKMNNTQRIFSLIYCGLSKDKDSALLLSKYLLPPKQMNSVNTDRYNGCYIDTFLSSEFKNSISHELNQSLVKTRIQDCVDHIRREIFLPSRPEIERYFMDALIRNVSVFSTWCRSAGSLLDDFSYSAILASYTPSLV